MKSDNALSFICYGWNVLEPTFAYHYIFMMPLHPRNHEHKQNRPQVWALCFLIRVALHPQVLKLQVSYQS